MSKDEVLQAIRAYMNDSDSLEDVVERHYDLRKQVEASAKENIDMFVEAIEQEERE